MYAWKVSGHTPKLYVAKQKEKKTEKNCVLSKKDWLYSMRLIWATLTGVVVVVVVVR